MTQLSDRELIVLFLDGNQRAFQTLLNKHQSKIFGFIISKVRDYDIANDIFQDAFIKIINNLKAGKYNEEGKFIPWAMRIVHNLIIDHFRAQKKAKFVRSNDEYDIFEIINLQTESKEDDLVRSQIFEDLKSILPQLPKNQKIVLEKRIFCKMSFNDIAEEENISINTALGRMRYALINLRKIIDKENISLFVD